MDIYTKIVLINIVLLFFIVWMNEHILNDIIGEHESLRVIGGLWVLVTLCSIPALLIHFIVKA